MQHQDQNNANTLLSSDNSQNIQSDFIDSTQLQAYEWLDTPIWAFDVDRRRIIWANNSAIKLWNAQSLVDLQIRNFNDFSVATETRIKELFDKLKNKLIVTDNWTIYPCGTPVHIKVKSRGIVLKDGRIGILFEGALISNNHHIEPNFLRGIQAIQHTLINISLYHLETGEIIWRNPSATRNFEKTHIEQLFIKKTDYNRAYFLIQSGYPYRSEVIVNTVLGERWHQLEAFKIIDPVTGQNVILVHCYDVTDRRTLENQLQEQKVNAEQANRAKSDFLASMSHEIRTPMNGIIGMTDLVLSTEDEAEKQEYLGLIKTSADSLLVIINDILDFSKIEAGKLELECIDFNIRGLIYELMKMFEFRVKDKDIQLKQNIDHLIPEIIHADPVRIRQILINLMGNAVKFTEQGLIQINIECLNIQQVEKINQAETMLKRIQEQSENYTSSSQLFLRFKVSDSGIGIPKDKQPHIFQAFTQADISTTRRYGGTGLGLTICSRLMELMQGCIYVESEFGKGSDFCFIIPVSYATSIYDKAPNALRQHEFDSGIVSVEQGSLDPNLITEENQQQLNILLAEDNLINQKLAVKLLQKAKHHVTVVNNGLESLDYYKNNHKNIDIILMDVQMPVMTGLEATQAIRIFEKENRLLTKPIIAMTAHAMQGDKELCIKHGMTGYVAKPINLNALLQEINKFKR